MRGIDEQNNAHHQTQRKMHRLTAGVFGLKFVALILDYNYLLIKHKGSVNKKYKIANRSDSGFRSHTGAQLNTATHTNDAAYKTEDF